MLLLSIVEATLVGTLAVDILAPTRGLGGAGLTGKGAEGFEAPGALGPLKPQAPASFGETGAATSWATCNEYR